MGSLPRSCIHPASDAPSQFRCRLSACWWSMNTSTARQFAWTQRLAFHTSRDGQPIDIPAAPSESAAESAGACLDEEGGHAGVAIVGGPCEHGVQIGDAGVGDPRLGAVEDPMIAVAPGASFVIAATSDPASASDSP